MDFRREMLGFSGAVALVLAAAAPLTASAQGGFPPPAPPPYTPAADAKDLKAVLFNWTWHMGMLRGIDEHELMVSLEYQGKGTVQVDGQPCALTKYRASINYQTSGERIQYTCTRATARRYSAIEVVSGPYAWNEDIVGAEIVHGEGQGDADCERGAGAADPAVGEPAGRAESRAFRRQRSRTRTSSPTTVLQTASVGRRRRRMGGR